MARSIFLEIYEGKNKYNAKKNSNSMEMLV